MARKTRDTGDIRMAGTVPASPRKPMAKISFYQDDGYRLDGELYQRRGIAPTQVIVFCHGWGATREFIAPLLATGLTDRLDCAVVVFDYSGWGTSEGPRQRLDPFREVQDVRSAVSWTLHRFPTAASRVGLFGISFGAGVATRAAAVDNRIGALVAVSSFSSGSAFMRDMRPQWQFIEFEERVASDRIERSLSGRSELVDPDSILVRDPEASAFNRQLLEKYPSRRFQLDLVSAGLILDFEVVTYAGRIRGRPSLFIHAERDLLIPYRQSMELAEAAGGRFLLVPGIGHYDFYSPPSLATVLDEAARQFLVALAS